MPDLSSAKQFMTLVTKVMTCSRIINSLSICCLISTIIVAFRATFFSSRATLLAIVEARLTAMIKGPAAHTKIFHLRQ